jgi:hypothetical protein
MFKTSNIEVVDSPHPMTVGGTKPIWWADASDDTSYTITGSGVSEARCKAGSGIVFSQGTDANRPTNGDTINGRKVWTLDGTSQFLATAANVPALSPENFTFFAVFQVSGAVSYKYLFSTPDIRYPWTATSGWNLYTDAGAHSWAVQMGGGAITYLTGAAFSVDTTVILTIRHDDTDKGWLYKDGTQSDYDASVPLDTNNTTGRVAAIGCQADGGGSFFNGKMCEIGMLSALQNYQHTNLVRYCANKWGATV